MADKARSATILVDGSATGTVDLLPKTFKSGSTGFYANGKITIDGQRYQVGGNVVLIGSKPQ